MKNTSTDERTHMVYRLVLPNGDDYVGVTARTQATIARSVLHRAAQHWNRAHRDGLDWSLCRALRQLASRDDIQCQILDIVQGKAAGHAAEIVRRRELCPTLNTDRRGD